jgi:tRNA (guanosine-2'-O-)-methyltransferase
MTSERFQKIKAVLNKRQPDLTVIVDNVNKPHNIAAIFRSCDAVGIPDLHGFSSHEKIVGVNLKSASRSNNWVKLQVHDSITSISLQLKSEDYSIHAANSSDNALNYQTVNYTKPTAIGLGAEFGGLSEVIINEVGQIKIQTRSKLY